MAHEWLKWVREFFTQQHTRGFKPSLERNGKTLTFATYADKLQFQCKEKVIMYANGNDIGFVFERSENMKQSVVLPPHE